MVVKADSFFFRWLSSTVLLNNSCLGTWRLREGNYCTLKSFSERICLRASSVVFYSWFSSRGDVDLLLLALLAFLCRRLKFILISLTALSLPSLA